MNEQLLLSGVRQHELRETAESLNAQLQLEIADQARSLRSIPIWAVLHERFPPFIFELGMSPIGNGTASGLGERRSTYADSSGGRRRRNDTNSAMS